MSMTFKMLIWRILMIPRRSKAANRRHAWGDRGPHAGYFRWRRRRDFEDVTNPMRRSVAALHAQHCRFNRMFPDHAAARRAGRGGFRG